MTPKAWRDRRISDHLVPLSIFVFALAVSIIVRLRLLDAPLERDEGEHAYLAQMLLAGHAPWQVAYNLKLPGTDFMYAIFMAIFGQTAVAIRTGLLLVNTATIVLVAWLGKRLFGRAAGAAAGASYALLASSQGVYGTIAHATHFVVFFAVVATLLLLKTEDRPGLLFASGLIYGLAFLMKQPGLAFGIFGGIFIARRGLRALAAYSAGLALPYSLLCLALWMAGTFPRFWFWTVTLARAYASQRSFSDQLRALQTQFPLVLESAPILWILAGAGLALACSIAATRRAALFVAALAAFSLLAVAAGGTFNAHYFILLLPAVALGAGAGVAAAENIGYRRLAPAGFALACMVSVVWQRNYLFQMGAYDFERASYGLNPFPEARTVADYIRARTEPDARIAVLGSEAEIYFYARRRAATGYLFTYGLMETHPLALPCQAEMIQEIETARPEYIVFVGVRTSWLVQPDSAREIFRWEREYTHAHYETVGAVNLEPGEATRYTWGPEASVYDAASPAYMTVYRRR